MEGGPQHPVMGSFTPAGFPYMAAGRAKARGQQVKAVEDVFVHRVHRGSC